MYCDKTDSKSKQVNKINSMVNLPEMIIFSGMKMEGF